jgi:hypothetical protein
MDVEQLVERNPSVVGQLKMREDSKAMVMKLRVSETMTVRRDGVTRLDVVADEKHLRPVKGILIRGLGNIL